MAALTPKELVNLLNIIEEVLYFFSGDAHPVIEKYKLPPIQIFD